MGTEYDIVSDATREGYELGKGPWYRLDEALRSQDPAGNVTTLMLEEFKDPKYVVDIVKEVVAFAAAHPDWRVINDSSSDISVMTDEEYAQMRAEDIACGDDPDEFEDDIYKKVGSRYRETALSDAEPMAIEPTYLPSLAEARHDEELRRKGVPIPTMADLKKMMERRLEQAKREAKALLRFEPGTLAPHARITVKVVSANVMYVKNNTHYARDLLQLDEVEVFRPLFFEVQTPDGDLWVESVRVNGHENLAGDGASSVAFNGKYEVQMDSGKLSEFEVTLRNDGDEPRRFAVGMEGKALLRDVP